MSKTMFKNAIEAHATIEAQAKANSQEVRDCRAMKVGQWFRQGDVVLTRIDKIPFAWNVQVTEHRQVALGQTTGSRHCAEGDKLKVLWPVSKAEAVAQCPLPCFFPNAPDVRESCLGPVVVAERDWTLTHPEHGHDLCGAGIYLTTYEANLATRRQVRD